MQIGRDTKRINHQIAQSDMLSKYLCNILHVVNKAVPKSRIVLFNSFPAYSDNALALYEYIIRNRPDIVARYKLVWGQASPDNGRVVFGSNNTFFVKKKSVKGFLTFLRAKYVISTHGYFTGLKSGHGQLQVNLWHGYGYKDTPPESRVYHGDLHVVSSEIFTDDAVNLSVSEGGIKITGYPRNDYLFHKGEYLRILGIDKKAYKKVLIWLPTYRASVIGGIHNDGLATSFGIGSLTDDDLAELNDVLRARSYLLLIKPHPMDSVTLQGREPGSNIKIFTSDDLARSGIDLYELMTETDVLLSDYSSVVFDYCLLDKPVAMVLSDMAEYKATRGFIFDNVTDWFPGPVISDLHGLVHYLNNMDNINREWIPKRKELSLKFNKYRDGNSSERVCNLIFGERV